MYSNPFRRVFKNLSPRSRAANANVTPKTSSDEDISAAAEEQYSRYIARLSTRVDAQRADVTTPTEELSTQESLEEQNQQDHQLLYSNENDLPDWSMDNHSDEGPALSDSPPHTPPNARIISRLHRRAVRDVNALEFPQEKENDPSSSSPVTPVHSDEFNYSNNQINNSNMDCSMYNNENENNNLDHEQQQIEEQRELQMDGEDEEIKNVPVYTGVDPATHFTHFVPVGSGGSGSVFFATHMASSARVALKRVTPHTTPKRKALETEIRTLHSIRHDNILCGFGAYAYDKHVWIVMEAMDIGSLTSVLDFLRERRYLLSEAHVAYILREAIQGLWAMHSRKCMHRDVKSDNVLVSSNGQVKLGDFEYSAQLTDNRPKRRTVVGTAWWMSPETVRQSYYDYAADVWSVGILAIECAEWVPPLFGMESKQAMDVIKNGVTHQGFRRPEMWSVEFADFVRGCLTRDRNLRYTVPQLLNHPFLKKACHQNQIANVFRAVKGLPPI